MSPGINIKAATFDDLPEIARIHVRSWQETYVGQVPQDYLDRMDVEARQKKWEEFFRGDAVEDSNLYLACDDARPIGFISFGRGRDRKMAGFGEI